MRYFLATLGFIFLLVIGIVIFGRGGTNPATTPSDKTIKLTSYATNNAVQVEFSTEGPINAPENHRTIQIVVSPTSRTLNVFQGYQSQVLSSQTFPNDTNSYGNFLEALKRAGFTSERRLANGVSSKAVCPLNSRTHYQVVQGSKRLMDLWSAGCTTGSFAGNTTQVKSLFNAQIPNYGNLVSNVNVGGTSTSSIF